LARRAKALEAADWRGAHELWLDHGEIVGDDLEWMAEVERLTLWNVVIPAGFLARLGHLWWLDVRGGTGVDASYVGDAAACAISRSTRSEGQRI
jgi:hypothetical protein